MRSYKTQSTFETLENRQLMSAAVSSAVNSLLPARPVEVQSYDGTGNNRLNIEWGSTAEQLLRLAPAAYGDGLSTPAGANRPSARAISNALSDHGEEAIPNDDNLSAYAYLWGQFIDHDLDLTNSATPAELFSIAVPKGDASFDPAGTGTKTIPLTRSEYAAGTGVTSPRQQVTSITAFVDGSMIYGSDATRAAALRSFVGGKLKTGDGNLLPNNTMGLDNATLGGPPEASFAAGDVRANENVELSALHTLFMREHNRRADEIADRNPSWTDEQIYQAARRIVIAEVQAVTYNEFLPALLGQNALRPYSGYKANVNPGISNEFSTAAFRLGHSMLPDDVEFLDDNGNAVREELSLSQAFFNPAVVRQTGIDSILKYVASSNSEQIDTKVVDSLRNFLFGPPGSGGLDLVSLNIQRGRDHGLADYNTTRAALGLPKVTSFSQITSDSVLAGKLQEVYGSVDNIDLWVGGLAEDHVPGAAMGATFRRILADQFSRTRDGDRFWYQSVLSPGEVKMVENTRLSDIIKANTTLKNVQKDVFFFNASAEGRLFEDRNGNAKADFGETGIAGRKVNLLNADGVVVASTSTDRSGRFVLSGLELGSYSVVAEVPASWTSTTQVVTIAVNQGGVFKAGEVGQRLTTPPTQPVRPTPPPPPQQAPSIATQLFGSPADTDLLRRPPAR